MIPGGLNSVSPKVQASLEKDVLATNKRLVLEFSSDYGDFILVMIGALIVGEIVVHFLSHLSELFSSNQIVCEDYWDQEIILTKGDELGFFLLGSSVFLLFDSSNFNPEILFSGHSLLLRERLGAFDVKNV